MMGRGQDPTYAYLRQSYIQTSCPNNLCHSQSRRSPRVKRLLALPSSPLLASHRLAATQSDERSSTLAPSNARRLTHVDSTRSARQIHITFRKHTYACRQEPLEPPEPHRPGAPPAKQALLRLCSFSFLMKSAVAWHPSLHFKQFVGTLIIYFLLISCLTFNRIIFFLHLCNIIPAFYGCYLERQSYMGQPNVTNISHLSPMLHFIKRNIHEQEIDIDWLKTSIILELFFLYWFLPNTSDILSLDTSDCCISIVKQ